MGPKKKKIHKPTPPPLHIILSRSAEFQLQPQLSITHTHTHHISLSASHPLLLTWVRMRLRLSCSTTSKYNLIYRLDKLWRPRPPRIRLSQPPLPSCRLLFRGSAVRCKERETHTHTHSRAHTHTSFSQMKMFSQKNVLPPPIISPSKRTGRFRPDSEPGSHSP